MKFKRRHQTNNRSKAFTAALHPFFSILLAMAAILTLPVHAALGDDEPLATIEATAEAAPLPTVEVTEVITPESAPETAVPDPTDVPVESETPATEEVAPTLEPTETVVTIKTPIPATATSTPVPTVVLAYSYAKDPVCRTPADQPEVVTTDAWLKYECSYEVQVSGENLSSADVKLGWSVKATAGEGWSLQLLPEVRTANLEPIWSTETTTSSELKEPDDGVSEATIDESGAFTAKRIVRFDLRVRRTQCVTSAVPAALLVNVNPTLRGIDGQIVDESKLELKPFPLKPTLTAFSDPVISFGGALDFGTVGVRAEGPDAAIQTATVTLSVGGLDLACGDWLISVAALSLGSVDGSSISSSNLRLVGIDGVLLPDGGCDLDSDCAIAMVHAPNADAAITYTLGISLVIPEQAKPGAFGSSLSAAMRSSGV